MITINDDFVLTNKSFWRDAVQVQPVLLERLHLNKFNGRSKLVIQTVNGPVTISKDTYEKELQADNENAYVIIYNVKIDGKKVSKTYINQKGTNNKVLDRWVVRVRELKNLGFIKYKYGTYRLNSNKIIKVFPLKESAKLHSLIGKPGDIVAVYGKGDYGIIDKNIFDGNYELTGKR